MTNQSAGILSSVLIALSGAVNTITAGITLVYYEDGSKMEVYKLCACCRVVTMICGIVLLCRWIQLKDTPSMPSGIWRSAPTDDPTRRVEKLPKRQPDIWRR